MELINIIDNLVYADNGCITWYNPGTKAHYKNVTYKKKREKLHRLLFRLKYRITNLPSWAFICHTCDNPNCCNLEHLFLGNASINMQDRTKKGRLKGVDTWRVKRDHSNKKALQILKNLRLVK